MRHLACPDLITLQAAGDIACHKQSRQCHIILLLQGSWTPLHADVLRSYSWSVNITGAKRWLLLPPRHTHLLFDRFGRQMAPSFDTPPGTGVPDSAFGADFRRDSAQAPHTHNAWTAHSECCTACCCNPANTFMSMYA